MHEYENHNRGAFFRRTGGVYISSSDSAGRKFDEHGLQERHGQDLYGAKGIATRGSNTALLLQLTLLIIIASLVAGCGTSAGNPSLAERNAELVCPTGQVKVCPSAVGTASRLKKDEGACYCQVHTN
jgi:hypothetical protein